MGEIEFCRILNRNNDRFGFDSIESNGLVSLNNRGGFDMRRTPKIIRPLGCCPVSRCLGYAGAGLGSQVTH